MTEKRFTRHKSLDGDCTIYDELNDFQFPSLPLGVSKIFCDKLNELDTELKSSPHVDVNEIESLVCENQQLKLWQDNVFKLIKAKIKIYQHKPVSAPVSNPFSNTYDAEHDRLSRLSELESLLQEVLLL